MKTMFYPKLALDGMSKNSKLYLPYILTCSGMVLMHYIVAFISKADTIASLRGGDTIQAFLSLGVFVIEAFSLLFLIYTNSFLIRRRKKEFGLYNMLGMGKKNLALILLWENVITAAIALIAGISFGILFSKLAELGLIYTVGGDVNYTFTVSPDSIIMTVKNYLVIFAVLFLNDLRQIGSATAINLIKSENVGEKPPKGNVLYGVLGAVFLAAAYYIAVTVENPIAAMTLFLVAVLLVIGGTYLLMISGSVTLCRMLQKNKSFYYNPKHFVSVSSMAYRMKRNGAGLASICILATMVLVMVSSTTSLYAGLEDAIAEQYPRQINTAFKIDGSDLDSSDKIDEIRSEIIDYSGENGTATENCSEYKYAYTAGKIEKDVAETDQSKSLTYNELTMKGLYEFFFIPLEDYNAVMGTRAELSDGEALVYCYRGSYPYDTITFNGGRTLKLEKINALYFTGLSATSIIPSMYFIVPDVNRAIEGLPQIANIAGDSSVTYYWDFCFDTDLPDDRQHEFASKLINRLSDLVENDTWQLQYVESREYQKEYNLAMNGGLLYLGIVLSIVFLFATVLIIYYKQLSEGYEDRSRFEIMQKVGITKKEIRQSINSQLLTVFFLPLGLAAVHMCFAFQIIKRLLRLFSLRNDFVFLMATAISLGVFSLFYVAVYKITSNAYYNIVSGAKED